MNFPKKEGSRKSSWVERDGKSWIEKCFRKSDAANIKRAEERFQNLLCMGGTIYPQISLQETKLEWLVRQEVIKTTEKRYSYSGHELRKVAEGLDRVHNAGLIHGDPCLSNIGFEKSGRVLLYDWEIILEKKVSGRIALRTTPYCLHPEDGRVRHLTRRSDFFGLAALFFVSSHGEQWLSLLSRSQRPREVLGSFANDYLDEGCSAMLDAMTRSFQKGNGISEAMLANVTLSGDNPQMNTSQTPGSQ